MFFCRTLCLLCTEVLCIRKFRNVLTEEADRDGDGLMVVRRFGRAQCRVSSADDAAGSSGKMEPIVRLHYVLP